jgi:hypothetical protein
MATFDVTQKTEVYETLSSLNMAFVGIVQSLQMLQKTGLFQSKAAKLFPSFAQELQAEFNQEQPSKKSCKIGRPLHVTLKGISRCPFSL